jgi:hypothetical protein
VVAGNLDHRPVLAGRRYPERVALSLHDEHGDIHLVELGETTGFWASRWVYRKRETEHRDGADRFRGPAGDARSE